MDRPEDIAAVFAPALLAGRFDELKSRYTQPLVLEYEGRHHILGTDETLTRLMERFRRQVMATGAVSAKTRVRGPAATNGDTAFVNAVSIFSDAGGATISRTRSGYVLRREGDAWKIMIVSFDTTTTRMPAEVMPAERV